MLLKTQNRTGFITNLTVNIVVVVSLIVLLLSIFGSYRPEIILSGSMKPLLNEGDIAIARKVGREEIIRMGDIYTYKNPGVFGTVTHRCIRTEDEGGETVYVFKGDNNEMEDEVRVKRSWIKYKLVRY